MGDAQDEEEGERLGLAAEPEQERGGDQEDGEDVVDRHVRDGGNLVDEARRFDGARRDHEQDDAHDDRGGGRGARPRPEQEQRDDDERERLDVLDYPVDRAGSGPSRSMR
jgi:hypothetical protein